SSRRRHTRCLSDWSSDVCSSDLSAIIPWAVFTRYVLNSAASWPEPLAVLLTIVVTFIGAAAGYRLNLHMNVAFFADKLPAPYRRSEERRVGNAGRRRRSRHVLVE